MVSPRSALALIVCLELASALGCASYSAPAQKPDAWAQDWKQRASRAAEGAANGATAAGRAVGSAVGTAYQGVTRGFEDPDEGAFGRYPRNYAETIRKHMTRFEGIPQDASYRFHKPEKGYINKGILAGGGIEWQGYLVEVQIVVDALFESQSKPVDYVVRMRDGDVVEVIEAEYAGALHWAEREEKAEGPPAARK